jgi:S1-C subfamily serine protease
MLQVYNISLDLMKALNTTNEMPFTATKSEESEKMSFKVTLGIMPDYVYDGVGLRVDGVNLGKPGEKAGLLKGDIIIKMGDYSISNIQDYMKSLGQFKKDKPPRLKLNAATTPKPLK